MKEKIRTLMTVDYETLGGYAKAGERWSISGTMAWRIIKQGYWPKDKEIIAKLEEKAKARLIIERAVEKIEKKLRVLKYVEDCDPGILWGMEYSIQILEGVDD